LFQVHNCALALALLSSDTKAGEVLPSKWGYNLFHPVPEALMREMSTDRPDQTESPFTVDAGHFQVEMDFVNGTLDNDGDEEGRSEVWSIAPLNLKLGLLNNIDIQFVLDTYVDSRVEHRFAGKIDKASGLGDLQTRLKVNFWGNDGGDTALAMMPFVKWPLSSSGLRNGKTEGGVIVPFGWCFAESWNLGLMTEFDFVSDGTDSYDTEFVNSITLGPDLTDKLGMYIEFFAVAGSAPGFEWQGQLDVGWTYALNDNTQFDLGCNFGVTSSAPDYNPFIGLSFRF
jgi:hypothetical protein